ncbi:MAG: NUDIX hydrolase [Pseudonocardia sp. SCN 72-86]|nr:MAG: NUDIX hydrolase [Pseudonocardia sp. SCN 72-86]
MSESPTHSVAVAGVVVNDAGRVLVVQRRDNGRWEAPGGVLELGETFEKGVRREVEEETGVDVEVQRLTGVYKNMKHGVVALVFRCRPIGGTRRETEESQQVEWLTAAEIHKRLMPAFAVRIEDALHDGVSVRVHDGVNVVDASN